MAMTACYRNFDIPQISQGVSHAHHLMTNHQTRHHGMSLQSLQSVAAATALSPALPQLPSQQQPQKDYSMPLHVDCSVEYELPNQAKPPVGARVEPLLMIHPCYFRKMESQRRSPFINNMPNQQPSHISQSSSNSIDSSNNTNRSLRQHSSTSSSRHHNHISQSTSHHHIQLPGSNNLQLPSSTSIASSTSARIRSSHHQQQLNLQQQIDEYVQRQIVQMSAPPPPSITYSSITNSHNTSQHNNQSTSSNNSSNNHYLVQQSSQRAPSTWDPYSIPNVGQSHHKSTIQQHQQQQQQKIIQCHNSKQASHISNTIIEGGGLLCTGRWGDVIEKTSSLAAIPRDYQSGPECIPTINKSNVINQTSSNMYRNTVGKRDAMLSGGCNMYNNSDNTAAEISQATAMWKTEKASVPREYQLESNNNTNKIISNSSKSSSSNNNNIISSNASSNSHNYTNNNNNNNSLSAQVAQVAQDQRHRLSGKYKQYLRSQRMHPYSMLPSGMTTTVANSGNAFPPLGATPTMFQQVSCFNV